MSTPTKKPRRTILGIIQRLDLGVGSPISAFRAPIVSFDVAGILVPVKSNHRELRAAACFIGDTVEATLEESGGDWWLVSVSPVTIDDESEGSS